MRVKLFIATALCLVTLSSQGQSFVNKLKQKASQAADKALEKKATGKTETPSETNSEEASPTNDPSGRPANKKGSGLVSTPPDVNQNLSDAETALHAANYSEARYAVQQAMLGIEMEIGQKLLTSLPEEINGVSKVQEEDQVTSTGYGWAGLMIVRVYRKDDVELKTTIANNSGMMAGVNMYLANGGYAQSTGGQQNWKQTKVKGHKAIIEYDENSGYKLSVPLGQSSLIAWEGINYASEQEMLTAASAFDIDGIKKTLGEQ